MISAFGKAGLFPLCAESRLSALQQKLALFGMFDLAQIAVGQPIVRKAEDEAREMACYDQQRFLRRSEASNSSIFVLRHLLVASANPPHDIPRLLSVTHHSSLGGGSVKIRA